MSAMTSSGCLIVQALTPGPTCSVDSPFQQVEDAVGNFSYLFRSAFPRLSEEPLPCSPGSGLATWSRHRLKITRKRNSTRVRRGGGC